MSAAAGWRLAIIPPAWSTMSPVRKGWEAFGGPIVWGVVCGLLLAVSAPLYIAGTVVGVLFGIGGGAQHATRKGALLRALAGGTLFGLCILLGYEISGGSDAKIAVPEPAGLLVAITLLPAFPLHLIGWRLSRARRREPQPA